MFKPINHQAFHTGTKRLGILWGQVSDPLDNGPEPRTVHASKTPATTNPLDNKKPGPQKWSGLLLISSEITVWT